MKYKYDSQQQKHKSEYVIVSAHLCGLVARVSGYRSRGLGSIPGATIFSKKQWVWNGVHSAS
jgi:hypothetical protein